jgi:RNA polymerase sigma factor (sigma-70 family)
MNDSSSRARLNTLQDEEIITQILTGDKKAFELIIRKYNAQLYRIGMAIVNEPTEVEDIMQTTYIKAYEHLSQFENRATFGTWLIRILINESLLQLKKQQHYIHMESENANEEIAARGGSNPAPDPMNMLMNKELALAVEMALVQLPEKYRLVFVLREMEGLNVQETVKILGITKTNVKVRLNRAKVMLRNQLSSYYKNDSIFEFHLSRCDRMVENVFQKLGI